MPRCEIEVRHVRLLGQRPGRPEIVTVDGSAAFGHPPDPLRVGVEILIVRPKLRRIGSVIPGLTWSFIRLLHAQNRIIGVQARAPHA
jgi:hypothetical protein